MFPRISTCRGTNRNRARDGINCAQVLCLLALSASTLLVSAISPSKVMSLSAQRVPLNNQEALDSIIRLRTAQKAPVAAAGAESAAALSTRPPGFPDLDVLECMQESRPLEAATIEDFKAAIPARLSPELALFSRAPRALDVTVVTAFSTSRLYMLGGMCDSWQGPISAAVYQGVSEGSEDAGAAVQEAKAAVQELFERTEAGGACQLDTVLYSEVMASPALVELLYPLNVLRDAALLMARTELVFILDGDMLISSDLSALVADPTRFDEVKLRCNKLEFMVIPAFDTKDLAQAHKAAAGGKEKAMSAFESEKLSSFLKNDFPPAHAPTNFTRWFTAKQHYNIEHAHGFEPWGLVSRKMTPFYDVRYRGYGQDKIQYLYLLQSLGFGYSVNADSFIVHRPHAPTKARATFEADLFKKQEQLELQVPGKGTAESPLTEAPLIQLHNVTAHFYGDFKWQLSQSTYKTLLTEGVERCRRQLPWWRDYQRVASDPHDPLG